MHALLVGAILDRDPQAWRILRNVSVVQMRYKLFDRSYKLYALLRNKLSFN
jgi:hypothetical protein